MEPFPTADTFTRRGGDPLAVESVDGVVTLALDACQQLAVLHDALFTLGFSDHMSGHITLRLRFQRIEAGLQSFPYLLRSDVRYL